MASVLGKLFFTVRQKKWTKKIGHIFFFESELFSPSHFSRALRIRAISIYSLTYIIGKYDLVKAVTPVTNENFEKSVNFFLSC